MKQLSWQLNCMEIDSTYLDGKWKDIKLKYTEYLSI